MNNLQPCRLHARCRMPRGLPHRSLLVGSYSLASLVSATKEQITRIGREDLEALSELGSAIVDGYAEVYNSRREGHWERICRCVVLIDQLFLGGQLTHAEVFPDRNGMYFLTIAIEDGNLYCMGSHSNCIVEMSAGGADLPPRVRIEIDSAEPWTFSQIIEFLVHEMVHGYVELFACRWDSCRASASHAREGHVSSLIGCIFERLRQLDGVPGDFGDVHVDYCNHRRTMPEPQSVWGF